MMDTDTKADELDFAGLDAQDEAVLVIKHPKTGEATTWLWTLCGPGHPKTVELSSKVTRQALNELRDHKQAQLNGKKIKVDGQTEDELREDMVSSIVARTKTFTPVKIDGSLIEFSPEAARGLLLDRRKGWLFKQIKDWLVEDES